MTRHFVEVGDNIRPKIESLVELLLDVLDTLDGDSDAEDGADDEPSLGSTECSRLGQTNWLNDATDDREQEHEHDEPSLGSGVDMSGHRSQEHWCDGATDDTEEQHDDEPDPAEQGICDLESLHLFSAESAASEAFRRNLDEKRFYRRRYDEGGFHKGLLRFPVKA